MNTSRHQQGVVLLEALIGILIFTIGILSLIALQAAAVTTQTDTRNRIDAATRAEDLLTQISLNVDRTSSTTIATDLATFAHQTSGSNCAFSGAASTATIVTSWASATVSALPGATSAMQQIVVNTGSDGSGNSYHNRITIRLCWQTAADSAPRQHTLVSYIN